MRPVVIIIHPPAIRNIRCNRLLTDDGFTQEIRKGLILGESGPWENLAQKRETLIVQVEFGKIISVVKDRIMLC